MKKILLLLIVANFVQAQTIKVLPYLQDAEPTSIRIMWETTDSTETTVEWGLTDALGNSTSGNTFINEGTARVHEVQLTGLLRFTNYYYRVKAGTVFTEIYQFKTPPFSSDNQSFRLVAMSDMQRDGNQPGKFAEIIENGVLSYFADNYGDDIYNQLGFVMIPGDLVVTGSNYSQWEQHFFLPSQNLFNQVPVYPVLGNHEVNSEYYFKYFHLPDNGTPGFEEHSWYKDYSNVRIVGLDTNGSFANTEQLDWLETILADACISDSIDFVFAQMHHPHKSELWTPGESNYSGVIIELLENFTTDCGKPSIHFFGHTHGYSRGQSQDHRHLMVNVATAGGAIDHWGQFPNADYSEYSKSQDEWGFVTLEVESGDQPSFTLKRISRGNETTFRDNEVRDSLTIFLEQLTPEMPIGIFPKNETVNPDCVILLANDFIAGPTATHGSSQWQVSTVCDDFSDPLIDQFRHHENWYFNIDTQAGDDLFDEEVNSLQENTDYCWRVRYRDRSLNWSEWSEPNPFATGVSNNSLNLLENPGAELDLTGWSASVGITEALTAGECDGINPHSGEKYFAVGGVCTDGPYAECNQWVDITAYADSIDIGVLEVNWGGYLSNWGGQDEPSMKLYFYDINSNLLDSTETISSLNSTWTHFSQWDMIPVETRIIKFTLIGTRNAGADNDSYFDDMMLRVGTSASACDEYVPVSTHSPDDQVPELNVVPNPFSTSGRIVLDNSTVRQQRIVIQNALGQVINCPVKRENGAIVLQRGQLESGVYFFQVFNANELLGSGQFIIQ